MQILDRRVNASGKSLENRQRFLRRAKALVQWAVRESSRTRDISDILEGGEVSIPAAGLDEPRFQHGPGASTTMCFRATANSSKATSSRAGTRVAAARAVKAGKGMARTHSASC